jgi:Cu2+-exporting ATPase
LAIEMLSGDRQSAVEALAATLNVTQYGAELLPTEKIQRLKELTQDGHKVLMVGDGLNDAPGLATAHASFSPSTAADISQTTAEPYFKVMTQLRQRYPSCVPVSAWRCRTLL